MNPIEPISDPEPIIRQVVTVCEKRSLTIPRHQHFDYEFIYLSAGKYEYLHNHCHLALQPGQGFLVRPGDWHIDYLFPDTRYTAVNFILKNHDAGLLREQIDERELVITDVDGDIARVLERLCRESDTADSFSTRLREIELRELYWLILRRLPRDTITAEVFRQEEDRQFARRIHRIAMQHIRQNISLPELAAAMRVSPRTLHNRCRELFGTSPLQAIMKIRMDHALELLSGTAMTIKDISNYLGFPNPYHFSKVFKRFFQLPPTACRKKNARGR